MKKRRNRNLLFLFIILGISIGFAVLTQGLKLIGSANFYGNTWDVHWENVRLNEECADKVLPVISSNNTSVTYTADLRRPGDFYEFYVDAVNDGSVNAMIKDYSNLVIDNDETKTLPDYLDFSITYLDDTPLAQNQYLGVGEAATYKVRVDFIEDITNEQLPENNISFSFKFTVNYQIADNKAVKLNIKPTRCNANKNLEIPEGTVCKRAEVLNYEICKSRGSSTSLSTGYCLENHNENEWVVYGTCGTRGTLTSGDAFDCDVDNSGTFDADERFYYVSPTDGDENSDYATLIYYKNVGMSKYYASTYNRYGPSTALNVLPSTEEWTNPNLNTNMTRQIKNELGENTSYNGSYTLPEFTYTGRAARLLTTQEIENGCGITISSTTSSTTNRLNNCEYLLENTRYSSDYDFSGSTYWWLENAKASSNTTAWNVQDRYYNLYVSSVSSSTINTYYVRPAIEVPFSKISY